jgi:hypothetical protein
MVCLGLRGGAHDICTRKVVSSKAKANCELLSNRGTTVEMPTKWEQMQSITVSRMEGAEMANDSFWQESRSI